MKPTGSNILSSASVANTVELGTPVALDTKTTRAASPPFATSTLFSPAPAIVARIASGSEGDPAGLRNSHHRTPLIAIEMKFSATAAASSGRDAVRIECHAAVQSIVLAKMTRKAMIAAVRIQRSAREMFGFTGSAVLQTRTRGLEGR